MVKTHKNTQIKSQQAVYPQKNQSNDSKDDLKSCKYKGGTDNQNEGTDEEDTEMFNKDREETKNRQSSMNNT